MYLFKRQIRRSGCKRYLSPEVVKTLYLEDKFYKNVANNLGETLKKTIGDVAEVAGYLWQKGWAERNAGNISVCLKDIPRSELPDDYQPFFISLPESLPDVAGMSFLITATNKRMRDLVRQPLRNSLIIRITDDGTGYNVISHNGKTDLRPTSELATHLGIHSMITRRRSAHRVVIHTHATELIALTQMHELCNETTLNKILLGMQPETKVFVPAGVGFVSYITPGTTDICDATVKALEKHDVAIWEKHGAFAIGTNPFETFDLIDILSKSASVYLLCRSAGFEPEGLSDSQIKELGKINF
jgi:rhamnulose-1-phosphate aldolase